MRNPTLTSRERVIRTINHQEPDRVPFGLELTLDIYNRLRGYFHLPKEQEKSEGVWTNVTASMDLIESMKLGIYRTGLNPPTNWKHPKTSDGLIYDEWNIGREKVIRPDSTNYYEMVNHP